MTDTDWSHDMGKVFSPKVPSVSKLTEGFPINEVPNPCDGQNEARTTFVYRTWTRRMLKRQKKVSGLTKEDVNQFVES